MSELSEGSTINEWVKDEISRTNIFQELEIDFCCGGHQTLQDACQEKGLNLNDVVQRLKKTGDEDLGETVADWTTVSPKELVDHLESTHHAYLKQAIPVLNELIEKVVQAHGARHPELIQVQREAINMFNDLESHLLKEERILFPMIRSAGYTVPAREYHCTNFQGPIHVMRAEHNQANRSLDNVRKFTDNYKMPADGCSSYALMLEKMKEFEMDLHVHVHKENNILFPSVLKTEGGDRVA